MDRVNKLISIIIPTYNEKANITRLVEKIHDTLAGHKYEIVFVDDNSKDGTAGAISVLSYHYPARVLVRKNERGLASAVVHGFKHSSGDTIAVMDADLQHPPEVLTRLLREIKSGSDLVIASRYVPGGGCPDWGLIRKIISKGAIFLTHLCLSVTRPISDPMSGFFMLRRKVITGADLRPTGYKILLEILIEGHYLKSAEVPYIFHIRDFGESKLGIRTQIDFLKHLFRLMRRKSGHRREGQDGGWDRFKQMDKTQGDYPSPANHPYRSFSTFL